MPQNNTRKPEPRTDRILRIVNTGLLVFMAGMTFWVYQGGGAEAFADRRWSATSLLRAGDAPARDFTVAPYRLTGDRIVFDYYAPFPGVTRVWLYDADGKMLWRNQYNDEEGDNQVSFKASALTPGERYRIDFEYKFSKVSQVVTVP